MKHKRLLVIGSAILVSAGVAAFAIVSGSAKEPMPSGDPRTAPPLVKVVRATRVGVAQRGFTGSVAARVQSNLGFRVGGKIIERLVDVGQQVKAGQPLMRIDETDLRLALTAKRNAVTAAQAAATQAKADERM
jgi:multidrug efflux pump subunit AcrA (membrane-fusion protein)